MAVTQARLDRYRADVDAYGDAAASYVEQYIAALIAGTPGMAVNELRDEAIEAVEDSLNAFGDQASALALDLFDEITEAYGIEADTAIYDTVPREMIDGGVRFRAIELADGRVDAFTRDVADLTRYYIHRSAFENMERNCERNDLRYARVPSGRETCGFCFMLSSRGFVYRSEQTAGSTNAYHDNCDCVIVPGFEGVPWNEQVEGYDPDAMYERWKGCLDTVGGDDALRSEWDAMDAKSKSRYKGDTDGERYRRFYQARVIAEAETRDFRWLNTGDVPSYEIEAGAAPKPKEIETARRLAEYGYKSRFRKTRSSENKRTSDVYFLSGDLSNPVMTQWEFKGPSGNGKQTIHHQFEEAAGQSHNIVVDCTRLGSSWTNSRIIEEVDRKLRRGFTVTRGEHKGEDWKFDEAIIVFSDGSISKRKRG